MNPPGASIRRHASWLSSLPLIVSMLGWGYLGRSLPIAIYGLSFWHYYLYWLAYYFGAVPLEVFKRDAIVMKTVSLMALGSVYLAAPWNVASLAVVGSGFLLNCLAARALGADRTYYGYEVADLPPQRITTFPYSWISHPMLVGNIMAFGGTLIDADFRRRWWPLAGAHVALNLGLLVMELAVKPQRRSTRGAVVHSGGSRTSSRSWILIAGIAVVFAALAVAWIFPQTRSPQAWCAAAAALSAAVYAYVLYCCYCVPRLLPDHPRDIQEKDTLWLKQWVYRR